MMSWSSMQRFDASTMTLTDPPHRLQTSIYPRAPSLDAAHQFTLSMLKTRFSRCAQVIAMEGMYAGFAGAKTGHRRVVLGG